MKLRRFFGGAALASALVGAACNGTTGDELISFKAYAVGAKNAGAPFVVGGYEIQLTRAKMHIGAVYFDESPPSTGFDGPTCITPDVYAAQVPGPVDVDLLSTVPTEFSVYGSGSADLAESWELWLNDGTAFDDIDGPNSLQMVDLTGFATRLSDGKQFSFGSIVTINDTTSGAGARGTATTDPAQPGQYPICKSRIIQLGGLNLKFFSGGVLTVTIDPRGWFKVGATDFASLDVVGDASGECELDPNADASYENGTPCDAGACKHGFACGDDNECVAKYCIPDTNYGTGPGAAAGANFFAALQGAGSEAYTVRYESVE